MLQQKSKTTFGRDGGDEDADGGPDQGRGVSQGVEAFQPDELGHLLREVVEMRLHIVLEDETRKGAGGLVLLGQLGQHIDQVGVKVRVT